MITRDTVRGAFPVKCLGDVAEFLDSKRRPVTECDRKPGPYPYYGANGPQGTIDGYLFDEPLILMAEDGGHFDKPERGIAYRISGKTWVNNHAHIIKPRDGIDLAFLCRVLENYDVTPFISGSTRAKLTKGQAEKIEIPLPPIEEQERIAAILDQADSLRRLRQRAIDCLSSLGQAIFGEMFGDPTGNPKNWDTTELMDLVRNDDRINYGVVQPGVESDNGVPLVRVADLLAPIIEVSSLKKIDAEIESNYQRSRLRGDEVLIACVGSIGAVTIAHPGMRGANIARAVGRIPVDPRKAHSAFVAEHLKTKDSQNYFREETRTVAQPTLNIKQLKEAPIMLPPLEQQQEFADVVVEVEKEKAASVAHLESLNALFFTLQHRAFRGEL